MQSLLSHASPHVSPLPYLSYEVLLFDVTADVANWIRGFLQHGQPGLVLILLPTEGASLLAATVSRNPPPPHTSAGLQLRAVHLHIWKVVSEDNGHSLFYVLTLICFLAES